MVKSQQAIKDTHIKRKDRFFKSLQHNIDEENVDKDSSDSEHEDGEYFDHNLYCESTTDIMMDQQPQALEEIQDENQEGELQAETEYTEDVPCKKGKVDIPMLTDNKKEMLKHLPHLHNVLLTGGKEKVRQTCVKLKNQYGEVMNHFKAGNANCNNLTKDDLATVLIPDDFDEIQNPVAVKSTGNGTFFVQFNINT